MSDSGSAAATTWSAGTPVKARYLASTRGSVAARWYNGVVTVAYPDGSCDIRFEDGDEEKAVLPRYIRALEDGPMLRRHVMEGGTDGKPVEPVKPHTEQQQEEEAVEEEGAAEEDDDAVEEDESDALRKAVVERMHALKLTIGGVALECGAKPRHLSCCALRKFTTGPVDACSRFSVFTPSLAPHLMVCTVNASCGQGCATTGVCL